MYICCSPNSSIRKDFFLFTPQETQLCACCGSKPQTRYYTFSDIPLAKIIHTDTEVQMSLECVAPDCATASFEHA